MKRVKETESHKIHPSHDRGRVKKEGKVKELPQSNTDTWGKDSTVSVTKGAVSTTTPEGHLATRYQDGKVVTLTKEGIIRQQNADGSLQVALPDGFLLNREKDGAMKVMEYVSGQFFPATVEGVGGDSGSVIQFKDKKGLLHLLDLSTLQYGLKMGPEAVVPKKNGDSVLQPSVTSPPQPLEEMPRTPVLQEREPQTPVSPEVEQAPEMISPGPEARKAQIRRASSDLAMQEALKGAKPEEKAFLSHLMEQARGVVQQYPSTHENLPGVFAQMVMRAYESKQMKNKEVYRAAVEYSKADQDFAQARVRDSWAAVQEVWKEAPYHKQVLYQQAWETLEGNRVLSPTLDMNREFTRLFSSYDDGAMKDAASQYLASDKLYQESLYWVYGKGGGAGEGAGTQWWDQILSPYAYSPGGVSSQPPPYGAPPPSPSWRGAPVAQANPAYLVPPVPNTGMDTLGQFLLVTSLASAISTPLMLLPFMSLGRCMTPYRWCGFPGVLW